ncbi:MAG: heme ABC transporter ATP-binding protein [Porticoccaceae bacterium]|nr:heme ABC transporter ATP-binding protein [Porticoccaceae bacterium]
MVIAADHLSLRVSGFDLLRDLSFVANSAEITVVVGPNGAGKSSLLKVLIGDLVQTSGEVILNRRALTSWAVGDKAKILAALPQHSVLNFPFTAAEVVHLGRIPHHTGIERDAQIVDEVLARVDAKYLQKRFYTQMSGGERQRVQLARVLAQIWEPSCLGERFLILDEPTSAFDLAHQQLTLALVRELADSGIGVIMVLHDLNLAARCADKILVLDGGKIAAQGAPNEVLTAAVIDQVFGVDVEIGEHPITHQLMVIS